MFVWVFGCYNDLRRDLSTDRKKCGTFNMERIYINDKSDISNNGEITTDN